MEKIDIIVPTCKDRGQLKTFLKELSGSIDDNFNIIATCLRASAATNRNYGLMQAHSDIVIMIDDDIKGFYEGWAEGLVSPLQDESVVMVSARLMNKNGTPGVMMNIMPDLSTPIVNVKERMLPSACIAFRKESDIRFDEAYEGAGFEDSDFCMQLNQKYQNAVFLINNNVKLIHANEMKNQLNGQLQINQQYFNRKWKHILCK